MKNRILPAAWKYLAALAFVLAFVYVAFGTATAVSAQEPAPSPAAAPQAATKSVWDGVYTKDQALRGQAAYRQTCGYCHRPDMSGSEVAGELAPELVGVYFLLRWGGPLSQLFIKIDDEMPKDAPGTVTSEATADIVSYLLEANGAKPSSEELPPDREKVKQFLITKKP